MLFNHKLFKYCLLSAFFTLELESVVQEKNSDTLLNFNSISFTPKLPFDIEVG